MFLEDMMRDCWVVDLGTVDYEEALELQKKLAQLRLQDKISDVLLLLEHPHVITLGALAKDKGEMLKVSEEEIRKKGVKVLPTNRGGKVTYHGPGQIIGYAIRGIDRERESTHVCGLEDTMIETLKKYGVRAFRYYKDASMSDRYVGVWCDFGGKREKIGATGLRLFGKIDSEGKNFNTVTMHGFALYINTDLSFFDLINPCGYKDKGVTSLQQVLGREVDMNEAKQRVADAFSNVFGYRKTENKTPEELKILIK